MNNIHHNRYEQSNSTFRENPIYDDDNSNLLLNHRPITNNRFNNNTVDDARGPYYVYGPYYVSGASNADHPTVSTINVDNNIPYNGSTNNTMKDSNNPINRLRLPRLSTTLHNTTFPSSGNRTISTQGPNYCKTECVNDQHCNRWSYTPDNKKCILYYGTPNRVIQTQDATSGEIYLQKMVPNTMPTPIPTQMPTPISYNCKNTDLSSDTGDMCLGSLQDNGIQLCYNVGINSDNPNGWLDSIGDIGCNTPDCTSTRQKCANKPLCIDIGKKCNLSNFNQI